ncbi:hemerythrin domain-containing protein [Geomonas sp. RF6]|uniref:hemerythrin domain-containing protein n=1 Tax=Geomonas sp. RF6 TaxID=2897342 RepID=UPI001E2C9A3C|nr:hemerythrin domain-containing protein [Geomonas sp. RF6]UFS72117.1 hemerythrin domain-containing protein [Geomonas sp. RF6]
MAQQKQPQLFELLKKDHREVDQLLSQLEGGSEDQREELFSTLQEEFTEHCQLEEKFFYPQMKKINELKDLVQDALEEHSQAKELLVQLEDVIDDDDEFQSALSEFKESVQHHVKEEESKVFKRTSDFISDDQLRDIAMKCMQEKEKLHPSPSGGGGSKKKSR